MKVVLDTNVLVSAMFWYGDSFQIIKRAEEKKLELVLSRNIPRTTGSFSKVLNALADGIPGLFPEPVPLPVPVSSYSEAA